MNLKYPRALLKGVRENKERIKIAVPPPGMPSEWGAQLEDLKLRLVHFEREFRGAQAWIANNCASSGWFVSSNLPVRAASAALLCAERVLPLLPYRGGPLWSDVNYPGLKAGASRFNARCLRGLRPFRSYVPLREHFGPNRS